MVKFTAKDIVDIIRLRNSTKEFLKYLTPKTILGSLPKVKPVPFYVGEVIKIRRLDD